jgi:hypothetical protein
MTKRDEDKNFVVIGARKIPVQFTRVPIGELAYYEDNPRIYSLVASKGIRGDQGKIQEELWEIDTTKELYQAVKSNGGLIEEVVVSQGRVLEGNRRLCVYRKLLEHATTPAEVEGWKQIPARVLLEPISLEEVFILLGALHVKGKVEWKPFEQAGFIYRSKHDLHKTPDEIAGMLHVPVSNINQALKAYELMIQEGLEDQTKFSYLLEYAKRPDFSKVRARSPDAEKTVVGLVKANRIPRAEEMRRLPEILVDKKASKEFVAGHLDFEEALQLANARNPEQVDSFYRKLTDARSALRAAPVARILEDIKSDHAKRTKIAYFLKEVRSFEKAVKLDGKDAA